jgi:hypothetical protein
MPNADFRRELPRRRNSGSPTSENPMYANFSELRYGEVRRIRIPRTPVNRLWALLRVSPLHAVNHLLRFGRKLIEDASQTSDAYKHRLTVHVL